MPQSWINALNTYNYPVSLQDYRRAGEFPEFFTMQIQGNRNSTIAFENHFRTCAPECIEAFFEVVFWKLYSQKNVCQRKTDNIVDYVTESNILSKHLWNAVQEFIGHHTLANLRQLRAFLGLRAKVIAVTLTFPALASPETMPMVDKQVAKWVNGNYQLHNAHRNNYLIPFVITGTVLTDSNFQSYLCWIAWCREIAAALSNRTDFRWRARDVEMAVFTAQRGHMQLNVLD
jgi:hypothetical protein